MYSLLTPALQQSLGVRKTRSRRVESSLEHEKGKPRATWGRKATGLDVSAAELAGLPEVQTNGVLERNDVGR